MAELLLPFLGNKSEDTCQKEISGASIALSSTHLNSISMYIDILLRWNARINLTAVRDPEEIVTRHFGESLFAARHLFHAGPQQSKPNEHLVDIGSGAGFPGLPIKIWTPRLHVTLIESNHKKATFLKEVIRALILTNIDVITTRAEAFRGQAEVVTLRAVERFEAMLPVAARLVSPAGRLALLIGERQVPLAQRLASSLRWSEPIPIPLSANRVLMIGRNESD